jgi:hypothetical protein
MSGRRSVVKIISESLSHDEKHVVPTPLSRIRVGKRDQLEKFDSFAHHDVLSTVHEWIHEYILSSRRLGR